MMSNHDDMKLLRFMNYGYVPDDDSISVTLDDADEMFRTQVQLYDYLAREVPLEGQKRPGSGMRQGRRGVVYRRQVPPEILHRS